MDKPYDERNKILVLGLGERRRRDLGVGLRAVEALRQRYDLPSFVLTLAADGAVQGLYDVLDEVLYLVAVDAVFADASPGSIFRAPLEEYERPSDVPEAVHETDLLAALGVAELMGGRPRGAIFAVQVADTGDGDRLSPRVGESLPRVVEAVADELRGLGLELLPRFGD
ncbi:MAG: hydrogenase maturation protease [Chloroflexota bacterium]